VDGAVEPGAGAAAGNGALVVAVASGKGGTGKTMVAVSLALSAAEAGDGPVHLLDCDVETPNAALFLRPEIEHRREAGLLVPEIESARCSLCGRCAEVCAYHALAVVGDRVLVFREVCHGCGSCASNCPEEAIRERLHPTGLLEAGVASGLAFAQGRMTIGEAMAPPVIRELKSWKLSVAGPSARVILDAPPGTACPLVQTVEKSDYALLVTEPTPFGLHDLRLAVEVVRDVLRVPVGIVLNRERPGASDDLERFCEEEDLPILMRIPFDRGIAEAYSRGIPLVEARPQYRKEFLQVMKTIEAERKR
jgi:MinD superfamily P-loop ATPase